MPEFWERVEECGVWSAHPCFHRTTGGNGAEDKPTVTMVRTTTGISPLGLRAGLLRAPDRTRSCLARPHGAPRGSGKWAQDTDKDTKGQEGKRLAPGHRSGWQPGRGPWPGAHPLAPAPTSHSFGTCRRTHASSLCSPTQSRGPHEPSAHSASGSDSERHALTRRTQTHGHSPPKHMRVHTHTLTHSPVLQFSRAFLLSRNACAYVCVPECVCARRGRQTRGQRETEGQ